MGRGVRHVRVAPSKGGAIGNTLPERGILP